VRPIVDNDLEKVVLELDKQGIKHGVESLDTLLPEVADAIVAAAPAVVPASEPLIVLTRGGQVVGARPANTIERLRLETEAEMVEMKAQVEVLKAELAALKGHSGTY
jgi:hypothetical protein